MTGSQGKNDAGDEKAVLRMAAPLWRRLLSAAADLLWPPVCAACPRLLPLAVSGNAPEAHFCSECLERIEFMPQEICPLCGRPYFNEVAGHLCGDCLAAAPPFASARSALLYCGPVARSIARLKYQGDLSQKASLAALSSHFLAGAVEPGFYDFIIPLPISPQRLAERGFNQAAELARAIYRPHRHSINEEILIRCTDGRRHQAALSGSERRRALQGHFRVPQEALVRGRRLLLFDDVFTTGATASEAAKTLMKAGAEQVDVATVARTVLQFWR